MPSPRIEAPWSKEQVEALNNYQRNRFYSPITCDRGHGPLIAYSTGLECSRKWCIVRQWWAPEWMFLRGAGA
jgi:hypothetical protein